jgi:beta-glucosidase
LIYRSHGLSYSKFTLSYLQLSEIIVLGGDFRLAVSLTVENMGLVTGSEVIQVYISLPATSSAVATQRICQGTRSNSGDMERLEVVLDKYAVSYWNVIINAWTVEKGIYRVEVGTGSNCLSCLSLAATFEVTKGFEWSGL